MRSLKIKSRLEILGIILFSALPQLVIYPQGYYYYSKLPASIKYPLNVACFVGVFLLGYWYLKQHKSIMIDKIWVFFYAVSGIIIAIFYGTKYITNSFSSAIYLNIMALFDVAVSPIPFIIATIILYLNRTFKKIEFQNIRKKKDSPKIGA